MAIILVEDIQSREKFYPLTLTRPIADLQCGLYTVRAWWAALTGQQVGVITGDYLQSPIPAREENEIHFYIRSNLVPSPVFWETLEAVLTDSPQKKAKDFFAKEGGGLLAYSAPSEDLNSDRQVQVLERFRRAPIGEVTTSSGQAEQIKLVKSIDFDYLLLDSPSRWLAFHGRVLEMQFAWLCGRQKTMPISTTNQVQAADRIFIEPGAKVEFAFLNGSTGPIYIGKDAEIMEGAMIRGPFALGAGSVVKMGAKIYGTTTTGEKCTLGGEIKNVVFHKGSNKGHEGYLGDAMIGAWCNFGAGSGNSNVKNTASEVTVFDYGSRSFLPAGKKFGLLMGDYSRVAINSSMNTGSSIGVSCNVFGTGLLPKYVAGFSWGTGDDYRLYDLDQAINHIKNWMAFKGEAPSDREIQILRLIFERPGR